LDQLLEPFLVAILVDVHFLVNPHKRRLTVDLE
jgi:hypothetical protein